MTQQLHSWAWIPEKCMFTHKYTNAYNNFIPKSPKLEITQMSFRDKWLNSNISTSIPWNITQRWKEFKKLIHETTRMNLQRNMLMEKNSVWRGCILYDSLYITFMKWKNYRKRKQISNNQEIKRGQVGSGNDYKRTILGVWFVMEMFSINASFLVVISCNSFVKNCHWGQLSKGHMNFSIICYNCMWIYNYINIKSLIL